MRKGTDIIGLPVVDYETGDKFEKVEDIIFDPATSTVEAFLLEEAGWFSSAKVVPLQSVKAIGPDAVIIPSKSSVVQADQYPRVKDIIEKGNVLKGRRIMTTEGEDLGTASDLFFEEKTGKVEGYEVSGGIFADAYTGRSFVPAEETLKLGEDVAFVTSKTARLMDEQVGGIKGSMQATGQSISEAGQSIGEKLQDTGETVGGKLQEFGSTASDKVQEFGSTAGEKAQQLGQGASEKIGALSTQAQNQIMGSAIEPEQARQFVIGRRVDEDVRTEDGTMIIRSGEQVTDTHVLEAEQYGVFPQLYFAAGGTVTEGAKPRATRMLAGQVVDQARGRRARKAVRTPDGTVIVAEGQIVTDPVIARARAFGREDELLDAVGLTPTGAVSESVKSATQGATEQMSRGAAQVQQGASDAWDRFLQGIGGLQNRAAREREVSRINNALGRPVTRVILDKNDNVILNTGEIITHHAVEMARSAGELDILLDSVYVGEAPIRPEQQIAQEPGDASLGQMEQGGTVQ